MRNYWWPGPQRDINRYVEGCEACQRTKTQQMLVKAPLHPHSVPLGPWEVILVNLVGELPESVGYNVICMVVDHFSKHIHVIPTQTSLTVHGMAKIYRGQMFRLHGIPRKIIHD